MKILFIITGLGIGGAERLVTGLADEFSNQGHTVKIAFLTGKVLMKPKNQNIEIIDLGVNSVFTMIKAYAKLINIIKNYRPDVVNSHLIHANILARLLRLTIKIPKLISSAHNTNEEGRYRMLAYRLTDWLTDITTNVSDEARDTFITHKAVKSNKIITIHNGISTNDFNYSNNNRITIRKQINCPINTHILLSVGRLYEPKDYPNLFYALKTVQEKINNFHLYIAGEGPLKTSLITLLTDLKLTDKVTFLGARNDIAPLMSACDIFVLSSAWEGFGLVVAEAMACERLVVATDSGGVKEVLGDCGYLAPPKSPHALAEGIIFAVNQSEENKIIAGKKARQRILDHYSIEAASEKWLNLYQSSNQS